MKTQNVPLGQRKKTCDFYSLKKKITLSFLVTLGSIGPCMYWDLRLLLPPKACHRLYVT